MILTIDSNTWVEQIRGTCLGAKCRDWIEEADACHTPAIVLAEVAHRCLRDQLEERRVQQELRAMTGSSQLVAIDAELAMAASKATTELRQRASAQRLPQPGLSDGLLLATARRFQSRVLTSDARFRGLRETVRVE